MESVLECVCMMMVGMCEDVVMMCEDVLMFRLMVKDVLWMCDDVGGVNEGLFEWCCGVVCVFECAAYGAVSYREKCSALWG